MPTSRKTTTFSGWGLGLMVAVAACACSVQKWTLHPGASFTLVEPTTVSTPELSLMVGTNGWPVENPLLEENFLPVAVTMRNTGARTLCGGVTSARLSDASGASVAASFPASVVARLFGPLAMDDSSGRVALSAARLRDDRGSLVFVHGSHGGHAGGLGHSGHCVPHAFGSAPRFFGSPFSFSPFAAPRFPFYSRPYSPFGYPFPPSYPYNGEFAPYGYAPALPSEARPQDEAPATNGHRVISEIFTLAFASRPLAPQEDRSGFLFFPRLLPETGAALLTWNWYDCETQVLAAQLSTPVVARKRV